ncbi:MAG: hypothetical protein AMXMBFR36_38680 [Acidobacteriota bacterium]
MPPIFGASGDAQQFGFFGQEEKERVGERRRHATLAIWHDIDEPDGGVPAGELRAELGHAPGAVEGNRLERRQEPEVAAAAPSDPEISKCAHFGELVAGARR